MIFNINNELCLHIPSCAFISIFTPPFINRHSQFSYVVKTALIKSEIIINIDKLNDILVKSQSDVRTGLNICFITPDRKFNPEWINRHTIVNKNSNYIFYGYRKIYSQFNGS